MITKVLACKQSIRIYQLAGLYACAAHDLAHARLYFAKITPGPGQSPIEQRCQLEGLNLRPQ
jgi:hypothetical protein